MPRARSIERLSKHPQIDKDRMVIWGVSFGSFFSLQAAAALGDKLKGAAVSFVNHEPGLNSIMDMASPSFKMRFMYMAGFDDEKKFDAFKKKFSIAPLVEQTQGAGAGAGRRGRRIIADRVQPRSGRQAQGAEEIRGL